jgi:hypothetical protein
MQMQQVGQWCRFMEVSIKVSPWDRGKDWNRYLPLLRVFTPAAQSLLLVVVSSRMASAAAIGKFVAMASHVAATKARGNGGIQAATKGAEKEVGHFKWHSLMNSASERQARSA